MSMHRIIRVHVVFFLRTISRERSSVFLVMKLPDSVYRVINKSSLWSLGMFTEPVGRKSRTTIC